MKLASWITLVGLGLPVYTYVLYPAALFGIAALVQVWRDAAYVVGRTDRRKRTGVLPTVSVIIAAYNEEEVIEETLTHCLNADYPAENVEILLGVDGADDDTAAVARGLESERVRVFEFAERRGKISVLLDCVSEARGDILVFTDANTALHPNALQHLARHFDDARIGAVCGELRLRSPDGAEAGEGIYWRYEVALKTLEGRLNAVLGANGAIYALRRDLFPPTLTRDLITDDFVIPMCVRNQGYRVLYAPEAVAYETASGSARGEYRRRLRIGAGNWQALGVCRGLLSPSRGFVSFAFWSHKVLRWYTPFLLVAAFVANLFLLRYPWGLALFAGQLAFYGAAALGFALMRWNLPCGPLKLVCYFVSINAALGVGMVRGMLGLQKATWAVTARSPLTTDVKQ